MRTFTQLTLEQRYQIFVLRKLSISQAEIARMVGAHPSTISRELRRCNGKAAYDPEKAHDQAIGIRHISHRNERIKGDLKRLILFYLIFDMSPEQISGTLRKWHNIFLSFQSIYYFMQRDNWYGGDIYKMLRRVGKRSSYLGDMKRKPKAQRMPVANRISIHERPPVIDLRERIGDWEIDTIVGPNHQSALLSLTERKTRFVILKKLPNKSSEATMKATIECLKKHRAQVLSITSDNGSEFARHEDIAHALDASFYFADPYSSWQRGTNENSNGLVRQYFPKKTDFREVTEKEVQIVMDKLNNRPRKTLNFETPVEAFLGLKPDWLKKVSVAIGR